MDANAAAKVADDEDDDEDEDEEDDPESEVWLFQRTNNFQNPVMNGDLLIQTQRAYYYPLL